MEVFLAVSAFCVLSAAAVLVLVRRAVRVARRRVERLADRARLTARTYGAGPSAEVARLRRDMDRSLSGARRALAASRAVHAPVGDVPSLLARLELAARAVDAELRVLESQPDPARAAAQLEGPRSRARLVASSAAQLVDGLLAAAGHDADDLTLLQTACTIEADALRAAGRRQGSRHQVPKADDQN